MPYREAPRTGTDTTTKAYYDSTNASRTNTDALLVSKIRHANPGLHLTVVTTYSADMLGFAQATGRATCTPIEDNSDPDSAPLLIGNYVPPARRLGGGDGVIINLLKFGKYSYTYKGNDYIIYFAEGRDDPYITASQYILSADNVEAQSQVNSMVRDIGKWGDELHDEIWVFDQGWWQKSAELYLSVAKSRWEDVILDAAEKKALRDDVSRFFDGEERYEKYRIAWKRGVIYYGPPGNGKTISIKALANEVSRRKFPVNTMYVKSLSSFGGPEYSIQQIFGKARTQAPCILVFEDLDSMITDDVRSYFLNEVDGLTANQGVYMIGSTNHIERLDPGISKRPSRFDRKVEFPKPNEAERTIYCGYWRNKLKSERKNKTTTAAAAAATAQQPTPASSESDDEWATDDDFTDFEQDIVQINPDGTEKDLINDREDNLEFPLELCPEIARITDGFSFAYLQEAFVASLLVIAGMDADDDDKDKSDTTKKDGDKFAHLLLWRVIKKQIELLKEQL